jgi:CRISPR-associated protein Csb2
VSMSKAIIVAVRTLDGRYHGTGDGPPSPARLFQALVAGAGLSGPQELERFEEALRWLEARKPPTIASPVPTKLQGFKTYVPNNDLDALGGDARAIAKIRTAKLVRPVEFDAAIPWLYVWDCDGGEVGSLADRICGLAERVYQLGRSVDVAWASAEVVEACELDERLARYPGLILRPSNGSGGQTLACPQRGSLASLMARHAAGSRRFTKDTGGNPARRRFSKAPKARFASVEYESPSSRRVYELRDGLDLSSFRAWPLERVSRLIVGLRDRAAERLRQGLPDRVADVERVLVGRKADGADDGPTSQRVKIVPLPSIGQPHADRAIRRVLVEVPAACPLRADDVHWSFSGVDAVDTATGEVMAVLVPAAEEDMLRHYGAAEDARARIWKTVTPVALPEIASRRRIEPARMAEEAKNGSERAAEEAHAAMAVAQALRRAGIRSGAERIHVQREPFEARGERVEGFAEGTRFAKERLWHVELSLREPIAGPVTIGDGRFLGLGVMAPVRQAEGVHAFLIEAGLADDGQPTDVARALRRAVMARVQSVIGSKAALPGFFTGHEPGGARARSGHRHLTFLFDTIGRRLLVVSPHIVDRRFPSREERRHLEHLDQALHDLRELRAGVSGLLRLVRNQVDIGSDPLFTASTVWESATPYQVTRHMKSVDAAAALAANLRTECLGAGLPEPEVTPIASWGVPGIGLSGNVRLTFKAAVTGPIILGRSRHLGGGLFVRTSPS